MTNGMVEIGLISVSVVLGLIGLPIWVIGVMVAVSLLWWAFVHHIRFAGMLKAGPVRALGNFVLALFVMALGHAFGFILGGAFHAIMGLK